jgi:hypothetical protein
MDNKLSDDGVHILGNIESCSFRQCLRNSDNKEPGNKLPPIIFKRSDNPDGIKFVVISQDPGFSARKKFDNNIEKMKKCWYEQLKSDDKPKKSSPISLMKEIFNNFDIYHDRVYWTHSLKCIPWDTDKQIRRDWKKCAPECMKILKEELLKTSADELVVITMGVYALTMLCGVVDNFSIEECDYHLIKKLKPIKLNSFIEKHTNELPLNKEFRTSDGTLIKKLTIYPFYHPSAWIKKNNPYNRLKTRMIDELKIKILEDGSF